MTTRSCSTCRSSCSNTPLRAGCFRAHSRRWRTCARSGQPVVLSDGDIVFQPRKIQRSGIWDAVEGRVMIYLHKEKVLDHMQRRLSGRALCYGRRQGQSFGGDEVGAGRATDDGFRASGALRAGGGVQFGDALRRIW